MICPDCGNVSDSVAVPEYSYDPDELGECPVCGERIVAAGTDKEWENSKLATVRRGEEREALLMDEMLQFYNGEYHEDLGTFEDIDRAVYDSDDNLLYYVEVKERSCTLNGYRETMFPFAKIETAQELAEEDGVPVYIVLKFRDAWSRLKVEPDGDYEKGEDPFAPNYRPSQQDKERQVPVKYPVEQLEIMHIRSFCESGTEILTSDGH